MMLNVTLQLCFSWLRYVIDWKKILSVYQQIRTKPTPTVTYPYKISPTLVHRVFSLLVGTRLG